MCISLATKVLSNLSWLIGYLDIFFYKTVCSHLPAHNFLSGYLAYCFLGIEKKKTYSDMSPLLDMWCGNIFSPSMAYYFRLLKVSFDKDKFLIILFFNGYTLCSL